MLRRLAPDAIRAPFARYSHGIEVPAGRAAGLLFRPARGRVPTIRCRRPSRSRRSSASRNVAAILAEAGLGLGDIVRVNAYVTAREHMKGYMAVRDRLVGDPPPASTLMIVGGFTRPEFLVEVEVVAAGPASV